MKRKKLSNPALNCLKYINRLDRRGNQMGNEQMNRCKDYMWGKYQSTQQQDVIFMHYIGKNIQNLYHLQEKVCGEVVLINFFWEYEIFPFEKVICLIKVKIIFFDLSILPLSMSPIEVKSSEYKAVYSRILIPLFKGAKSWKIINVYN